MGQGGTVFHHQHPLAADGRRVVHEDGRGGFQDRRVGAEGVQVLAHFQHRVGVGGIDFVDDEEVGHAGVGFPGVILHLVTGAVRVGHHDVKIALVERDVVVAAVPEDDVGLFLGLAQDGFVVHAGEDDHAVV